MTTAPLPAREPQPLVAPELVRLFAAVIAGDPGMAPLVSEGAMDVAEWFVRKTPSWSGTRFHGNRLVGHVSVRDHARGPSGLHLPPGRTWELMRLAVDPDSRRHGIASALVADVERHFGFGLWTLAREHSPGHQLFASRGWLVIAETTWCGRPGGLVMAHTRVAR